MHFIKGSTLLSESANLALGGVVGKTKMLRGFSTYNFPRLVYVLCLTMWRGSGVIKIIPGVKNPKEGHQIFYGCS